MQSNTALSLRCSAFFILSALAVASLLFSFTAYATHQSTSQLYLEPVNQSVELGSTVKVQVYAHTYISGVDEVLASLTFDSSRLEFVGFDFSQSQFSEALEASVSGNRITIHRQDEAGCPTSGGSHVLGTRVLVGEMEFQGVEPGFAAVQIDALRSNVFRHIGPLESGACDKFNTLSGVTSNASLSVSDSIFPSLSVVSPAEGADIAGLTTFEVDASDNHSIKEVRFYLGGSLIGRVTSSEPVGPTPPPPPPPTDDTTNPSVAITNPRAGDTVQGVVTLSARATDNVAVAEVVFRCNGVLAGRATAPFTGTRTDGVYSIGYDTNACTDGSQQIDAQAIDTAGNRSTLSSVFVTVQNNISLRSPDSLFSRVWSRISRAVNRGSSGIVQFFDSLRENIVSFAAAQTGVDRYSLEYDVANCNCFGTQTFRVEVEDRSGNVSTESVSVNIQNAPGTPSNPIPNDGATGVSVQTNLRWSQASLAATYDVYFGQALPASPNVTGLTSTNWNPPGDLSFDTTYQWQVVARNTSGQTTSGPVWSFTTTPMVDTGIPNVQIVSPTSGGYVQGEHVFDASVNDDGALGSVGFTVDGATLSDTCAPEGITPVCASGTSYANSCYAQVLAPGSSPVNGACTATAPLRFGVSYDTTQLADGNHTLSVRAVDSVGNQGFASRQFNVDNQDPSVSITFPQDNAFVRGMIQVNANVSDNIGVSRVEFFLDDQLVGVDSSAPYTTALDTRLYADGVRSLRAVVYDVSGRSSSKTLTLTIDNSSPTVSITSPTSGGTAKGTVQLNADASDNTEVAGVEFSVVESGNKEIIVTDEEAPYSASLDTTYYPYGTFQIVAEALDRAGNRAQASIFTLFDNRPQAVALYLSPQRKLVSVNDTFSVDVLLNTDGRSVTEVSAQLTFDTSKLEVVDIDTSQSVFPAADTSASQVSGNSIVLNRSRTGSGFIGASGLVARIQFKAIDIVLPETLVNFQFVGPGSGPSRVIEECAGSTCSDILQQVQGGSYGVAAKKGDIGGASSGGPNGAVDVIDLGILLSNWGWTGTPGAEPADICGGTNGIPDGTVDVTDLGCMLSNWTA